MKLYLSQNVFDAALDRLRYLFDEFETIVVNISGGKDSTVILNLALRIAEETGRLPLDVLFIDREAEWQAAVDHVRMVMHDPRIVPHWFQVPLQIENATSPEHPWFCCWEEGVTWMRDKEPDSYQDNRYGTTRFNQLFTKILRVDYPPHACYLTGVRCEESPARFVGLTSAPTYKHITYGRILDKRREHFAFAPLYDWSYTDVWKAIHDNQWPYCPVYDAMYQHGVPLQRMRVSNVHHEAALYMLYFLQELEPDTWDRLAARIAGIRTAGSLGKEGFSIRNTPLPFMFASWRDYRDYLLKTLVQAPDVQARFRKKFAQMDQKYAGMRNISVLHKEQIHTILTADTQFRKLANFEQRPDVHAFRKFQRADTAASEIYYDRFIPSSS